MDRYEILKQKFLSCEKIQGTTMSMLHDPLLIQKMNHPDMDFILMDAEHGCYDTQNVIPMLEVCRWLGIPSFVRVQDSLYHLIAKAIDMGADGVMIPRVEELAQMKTVVDAVCFAPVGHKGAGGYAQYRDGETYDHFQHGRYVMIQIESQRGIDNLPAILDQYGNYISAVIIGPNDLSVMLGSPHDWEKTIVQTAIQKVFDVSKQYHKCCGIFCNDAKDAQHYRGMGANVLWTASDLQFYIRGYLETVQELNEIR